VGQQLRNGWVSSRRIGQKESTDISIRFEFNTSIDDGSVVGSVLRKLEEQGLMDLQSIGNKVVERFNRLIGK